MPFSDYAQRTELRVSELALARPRDNTPFRITEVRLLPCEDRAAVFTACIRRVLDSTASVFPQPVPPKDDPEQIGADECLP